MKTINLIASLIIFLICTSVSGAEDIFNLDQIYSSDFQYSLPRTVLESYLSGKAFDNPDFYSAEESEKMHDDIRYIYHSILAANPLKEKIAIMTAGGPGAGKTFKMRQDIDENRAKGNTYAYIDPDDVCLKSQTRTYLAEIASGENTLKARTNAYNKWRPASNAANHLILANLIRENYGFYFGTTSTSPATSRFFEFLKGQGYKIRLLHVTAPDDIRWESIKERDKSFVQTTAQDVKEKGLLLPQRISDTYLKYADEIEFYYRGAVKSDAFLAAKWLRSGDSGILEIIDLDLYEKIKTIHNEVVEQLVRPDLFWDTVINQ